VYHGLLVKVRAVLSMTAISCCRCIQPPTNHRPWSGRGYTSTLARIVCCLSAAMSTSSSSSSCWSPVVVAAAGLLHPQPLSRLSCWCWSVSPPAAHHLSNWLRRLHPSESKSPTKGNTTCSSARNCAGVKFESARCDVDSKSFWLGSRARSYQQLFPDAVCTASTAE